MAISDKSRKILWARSGNRCTICREELVGYEKGFTGNVVIGEECHIVSSRTNGPRHDSAFKIGYDDYDNLILLCRNHHKIVDQQTDIFTMEQLLLYKVVHEQWVKNMLDNIVKSPQESHDKFFRITTGKELVEIIDTVHGYSFDHDELQTEDETAIIAAFFEEMENYGDLMGMGVIDKAAQIRLGFDFNVQLSNLDEAGFWIFGERRKRNVQDSEGNPLGSCDVAILYAVRKTNPNIVQR